MTRIMLEHLSGRANVKKRMEGREKRGGEKEKEEKQKGRGKKMPQ